MNLKCFSFPSTFSGNLIDSKLTSIFRLELDFISSMVLIKWSRGLKLLSKSSIYDFRVKSLKCEKSIETSSLLASIVSIESNSCSSITSISCFKFNLDKLSYWSSFTSLDNFFTEILKSHETELYLYCIHICYLKDSSRFMESVTLWIVMINFSLSWMYIFCFLIFTNLSSLLSIDNLKISYSESSWSISSKVWTLSPKSLDSNNSVHFSSLCKRQARNCIIWYEHCFKTSGSETLLN